MRDELRELAVEACKDDFVYFAEFVGMVIRITGSTDGALQKAGEAVAQFVRDGVIVAGDLTDNGFAPWPTAPSGSAARIEQEVTDYLKNGETPGIADIAWFDLPSRSQV